MNPDPSRTTAIPGPPDAGPRQPSMMRNALWLTVRRITVLAAATDAVFFLLFWAIGSSLLQWVNVASMAIYGLAWWLSRDRLNRVSIVLIWVEVLSHAALGSLILGWGSGFHYFLMMFIPAIAVSTRPRRAVPALALLLAFYLGLERLCVLLGPLQPVSPLSLAVVHGLNLSIVFAMFTAITIAYVGLVRGAERRLEHMATRDPLTRLSNRRHFWLQAEQRAAQGPAGGPMALVLVDVDHFKQINDTHGHAVGDEVLTGIAERLREACRDHDVVARWGGEEFLLLLTRTDLDGGRRAAERIRQSIATQPLSASRPALRVTVSVGVTESLAAEPLGEGIARADRALYRSKQAGRDQVTTEPS